MAILPSLLTPLLNNIYDLISNVWLPFILYPGHLHLY